MHTQNAPYLPQLDVLQQAESRPRNHVQYTVHHPIRIASKEAFQMGVLVSGTAKRQKIDVLLFIQAQ